MNKKNRRTFLKESASFSIATTIVPDLTLKSFSKTFDTGYLMTVNGKIKASKTGFTLSHEHILVDFTGADQYDPQRWDHDDVIRIVSPYLKEIIGLGCQTFIECTPVYIGRDPVLLQKISDQTGLNIVTNTGYYGAADNKFMPESAYRADIRELAELWIKEFESGIDGSGIKPGFIKIGVSPGSLSELHKKIVGAAGITHLATGLSIASHTGPALAAFEELDLLNSLGVMKDAFIWVHAQNEKDPNKRYDAARAGAWVSLDGLNSQNIVQYADWLYKFKEEGLLSRVLVSHDAGWYSPGELNGGTFTPYTTVFYTLIPELKKKGFGANEIDQIFIKNPGNAFSIRIRKEG
jgi:phosphotriesterase-related protein